MEHGIQGVPRHFTSPRWEKAQLAASPSRKDGIDADKEQQMRKTYLNFIKALVTALKLPAWTFETATVFTHRFFAMRSFAKNDRFLVAASAVFLACKVDESPRALRDVAYVFFQTKNANKPEELAKLRANADAVLQSLMEHILLAERALLYTLSFCLNIDHPYSHLANEVVRVGIDVTEKAGKDFFQQAVNLLNDSLATTLCLQYEASTLAHAAMWIVVRLSSFPLRLPEGQTFTDFFNVSQTDLDDISPQILALYKKPKATAAAAAPLPQAKPAGPPLPSFRPIIIPDDGKPPHHPPASSRGLGSEVEEGEVAPKPTPLPTPMAVAPGGGPSVSTHQNGPGVAPPVAAAAGPASPRQPDSDAEDGIGNAPGSGDQNNLWGEPMAQQEAEQQAIAQPAVQPAQTQPATSGKRSRSPEEEGEIGGACKSPCLPTASR